MASSANALVDWSLPTMAVPPLVRGLVRDEERMVDRAAGVGIQMSAGASMARPAVDSAIR